MSLERTGTPGRAFALLTSARAWARQDSNKAQAQYQAAIAIWHVLDEPQGIAVALSTAAELAYRSGRSQQARGYLEAALAAAEKARSDDLVSAALLNLARLDSEEGAHDEASRRCERARRIFEAVASRHLWQAFACHGGALAALGADAKALDAFESAIDLLGQARSRLGDREVRQVFLWDKTAVYDDYLRLLARLHARAPNRGFAARALEVFEQRQARAFVQDLADSGARRFAGVPGRLIAQLEDVQIGSAQVDDAIDAELGKPLTERDQVTLERLRTQAKQLQSRLASLNDQMRRDHPRLADVKFPRHLDAAGLRRTLAADDVALVYLVLEEKTLVWVLTGERIELTELAVGEERIAYLAACAQRSQFPGRGLRLETLPDVAADCAVPYRALYRTLMPSPVAAALLGARRVFVIPTGALYAVPFEALTRPGPDHAERPSYLIEDLEVVYLASLSMLASLNQTRAAIQPAPGRLLALADPRVEEPAVGKTGQGAGDPVAAAIDAQLQHLDPLPESRREVQAIAGLLSRTPGDSRVLYGERASREILLGLDEKGELARYPYVVFATHGLLPGEISHLHQPALLLSPGTHEGLLTMSDIFGLRLNANLVVLSACNTAYGEYHAGEGIVGLTRAFLFAGSQSVVVTLWRVNDFAAATLDTLFFRYIAQGQPIATALRSAKLELLQGKHGSELIDPVYWAPIVLYGSGEERDGQSDRHRGSITSLFW